MADLKKGQRRFRVSWNDKGENNINNAVSIKEAEA